MGIITNIKLLQGMGIYGDRGARSPSLQFRRYNLVYGFNGSGKSTLSRLFASLEGGGPHPKLPTGGTFEVALDDGTAFGCPINPVGLEQRLLVFNSDYIEQNLQWAAGRANPVFYIGADQAEAANELTKVEGDIIQADAKREAASATEKAAEKTFANYKRERAKSVGSRLHLGSRKYEAPALTKDYGTWKDDDRPALTDDELKAAEDTRRLEEPMPRLETILFDKTTIETAYRFIADVCGQSLATVALDEVQQYPDMLLWLKHGHEYHEAHGIADCLLCGNAISSLAAEHTDLARMVDELRRAVDDDEPDFERLARARWRLGFLLAVHLAKEDKHVYPALKRHENASLASLATKYETEMGDIDQRYRDYLADWPIQMITKRWLQFRLATTDLMDKLVQRIKREERELYPLLDR